VATSLPTRKQSSLFQHGAGDVEQPIDDRTQRAGVAVTSGSQSLVFGLADGVVPNCDGAPIEGSVSQAPVAGVATRNDAALATSPRDRGGATQGAQSMIVSPLQSICEDDPTDAWQGIEDRHVTMLLPLSRHVLPVSASNGLGELLAEPVELSSRIAQLAIDESQSLDGHSDMRGRSQWFLARR
jgi:hypothetical protein